MSVNLNQGMLVGDGWFFDAALQYEIIQANRSERQWRVTTRAYRYALARHGQEILLLHWHPEGHSDVTFPHQHAALHVPAEAGGQGDYLPNMIKAHLPTARVTFEDAVWQLLALGAPAARDDWMAVLAASREQHIAHRSWS